MPYFFKGKNLDITTGGKDIILLHDKDAENFGLNPGDKVNLLWSKKKSMTATVDIGGEQVKRGEMGIFKDIWHKKQVDEGDIVEVTLDSRPMSIETIKKKILGKPASYQEIYSVIKDIVDGRLGEVETTYFAASSFVNPYSDTELYYVAKAMADTGEKFNLGVKVADKHSVGGLAGNRITPIIVSVIASLGIYIPKTSSRAITSPAGTADTMEVLCPVALEMDKIKEVVKKTKACLVWGGGLRIAPADDKIIKVSRPLALEPYDKMIVSIMAKKVATGVDYLIVDIPVGDTCKIKSMADAKKIERKFIYLGKKFGMKVKAVITPAKEPIGSGIGPSLEARDILRVMQQHQFRPLDLQKKACRVAGELLELKGYCAKGKGAMIAEKQIVSGEAWKKLNQIIVAQGGKENINSEEVIQAAQKYEIHASKSGKIVAINNKAINEICMNLGAPQEKVAGIHIHARFGEKITAGDKLFTMYADSEERLKLGILAVNKSQIYTIK